MMLCWRPHSHRISDVISLAAGSHGNSVLKTISCTPESAGWTAGCKRLEQLSESLFCRTRGSLAAWASFSLSLHAMYLLASSFALGEQKEQCRQLLATAIAVAVLKLACLGRELQHRVDQLGPRQTSSIMYFSGASFIGIVSVVCCLLL